MYLFFFAALFVIFQYMNQKKIFEDQESTISTLSDSVKERNDSIVGLTDRISDLNYFTLQGNENAMMDAWIQYFHSQRISIRSKKAGINVGKQDTTELAKCPDAVSGMVLEG